MVCYNANVAGGLTLTFFYAVVVSILFLFTVSCPATELTTGNITIPKGDTTLDPLAPQQLQAEVSTNGTNVSYVWESSELGYLGQTPTATTYLTPGAHIITLSANGKLLDSVQVEVDPFEYTTGSTIYYPANKGVREISLPPGNYAPFFTTVPALDNGASFDITLDTTLERTAADITGYPEPDDAFISREPDVKGLFQTLASTTQAVIPQNIPTRSATFDRAIDPDGDGKHTFKIYSFDNQTNYELVPAIRVWNTTDKTDPFQIWMDQAYYEEIMDTENDTWGVHAFYGKFLPQAQAVIEQLQNDLIGQHHDVDGSGDFTVLMTSMLNEDRYAIGFFNPVDYFKADGSFAMSNQADMLYMGVPDLRYSPQYNGTAEKESPDPNFSVESLVATLGHEYAHMVMFSQKSFLQKDGSQLVFEEDFLDEGISHLMESLTGYGESGGNLVFVNNYFFQSEIVSLSEGADTSKRRGGMVALLWWLFEKEGGIDWNQYQSSGRIIDKGGVTFLKKLFTSPYTGWENIIHASVKFSDISALLNTYANDYALMSTHPEMAPEVIRAFQGEGADPGEIVTVSPFVGSFKYGGNSRNIKMYTRNLQEVTTMPPYAITWGSGLQGVKEDDKLTISSNQDGMIYGFYMYGLDAQE